MIKLNPYLNFDGNTAAAFDFYKTVFGGEFAMVMRFRDMGPNDNLPASELDKIAHISLPLGGGTMLMASDSSAAFGHKFQGGNNFYVSMNADSKDEADRIFNALAKNGKVQMPMGDMPWGSYYGQLEDQFGIQWMMSFEHPKK